MRDKGWEEFKSMSRRNEINSTRTTVGLPRKLTLFKVSSSFKAKRMLNKDWKDLKSIRVNVETD